MNGIDNITGRIDADAQAEIDAILAQAKAQAADITGRYQQQADRETADIASHSAKNAAEREERLESVAQMEARKVALGAKQDMISKAFDKAMEKLCALPDEEYVETMAQLMAKASETGREQVIFAQKDRQRVGKAIVTRANELLAKAAAPAMNEPTSKVGTILNKVVTGVSAMTAGTAMLTMSEETRPISGGFILRDGDVEVNCSFETLIRLQRNELAAEVAHILFG